MIKIYMPLRPLHSKTNNTLITNAWTSDLTSREQISHLSQQCPYHLGVSHVGKAGTLKPNQMHDLHTAVSRSMVCVCPSAAWLCCAKTTKKGGSVQGGDFWGSKAHCIRWQRETDLKWPFPNYFGHL